MDSPHRTPELRERADAELSSRSTQGVWGNAASVLLAGFTTTLPAEHRAVFLAFCVFTAVIAITRLALLSGGKKLHPVSRPLWRTLLLLNIILSAASWGVLAAFTVSHYSVGSPNVTFMLMFAAAIAGAGVHVLVDKVSLAVIYIFVILGPPLIFCMINGGASRYLALSMAYYFFYLVGQSRRSTRSFWRGIEDNIELGCLAHRDGLTGLDNRLALERCIKDALKGPKRAEHRICLLYIDLNGFKQVNDRFTHRVGDLLLAEVAARLRRSVDPGATVCRLGGDEFCVFLAGDLTEDYAQGIAARILAELRSPANIEGVVIYPSASIGISFHPPSTIGLTDLLRTADQAMYLAKAIEGGGIRSAASVLVA